MMENKKYAPLIGKKLTWEMLEFLMKDMRDDILAENITHKKLKRSKKVTSVHTEDDGA